MSRPTHSQASLLLTRVSADLGRNREYKLLTGEDEGLEQAIFETERGQRTFEAFACWVDGHVSRARSLGTPASLRLFVGCKSGHSTAQSPSCAASPVSERSRQAHAERSKQAHARHKP